MAISDVPSEFLDHAAMVRDYLQRAPGEPEQTEADTRVLFIDPVLHMLGYRDGIDIRREASIPATKETVDFELRADGQPIVLVEAKRLKHDITSQDTGQCVQYAAVLGVRWCLVTNGRRWQVFDARAHGVLGDKMVADVDLDDDVAAADAWDVLSHFSRDSLSRATPLTRLLVARVVDDDLHRPDSPAVQALRRAVKKRFGEQVSGGSVVDGVQRLVRGRPSIVEETPLPEVEGARKESGSSDIEELIAAGLLPPDAPLECTVRDVTHAARLHEGRIELEGKVYATPSAAAASLLGGTAVNGWKTWRYKGERLSDLRERLRRGDRSRVR